MLGNYINTCGRHSINLINFHKKVVDLNLSRKMENYLNETIYFENFEIKKLK